jgi:hypothetical protein
VAGHPEKSQGLKVSSAKYSGGISGSTARAMGGLITSAGQIDETLPPAPAGLYCVPGVGWPPMPKLPGLYALPPAARSTVAGQFRPLVGPEIALKRSPFVRGFARFTTGFALVPASSRPGRRKAAAGQKRSSMTAEEQRPGRMPMSIALFDLDNFKEIDDTVALQRR